MTAAQVYEMPDYEVESVRRLTKDLRLAAERLSDAEARYLVDLYYTTQKNRIRANNQIRAGSESGEPNELLSWVAGNFDVTEQGCKSALHAYAKTRQAGRWMLGIHGIGPVIAAGMLAHIDIERAPTVGHIWRFAGLDPTVRWERKTKRPWNADLKVLCWKAGKSFVMLRGSKNDVYGKLYEQRKAYEVERNEAGLYADQAEASLREKNYGRETDARKHYEAGHLPPARIDARARRWTVKLFLAHVHHVMFESHFGEPPPKPYVLEHKGHAHMVGPPNWPSA